MTNSEIIETIKQNRDRAKYDLQTANELIDLYTRLSSSQADKIVEIAEHSVKMCKLLNGVSESFKDFTPMVLELTDNGVQRVDTTEQSESANAVLIRISNEIETFLKEDGRQ